MLPNMGFGSEDDAAVIKLYQALTGIALPRSRVIEGRSLETVAELIARVKLEREDARG